MTEIIQVGKLTAGRNEISKKVKVLKTNCQNSLSETHKLPVVNTIDKHWFFSTQHKVTGSELNALISKIQGILSYDAGQRSEIWKSFIGLYKTIDILDTEYLSKIDTAFDQINKNYEKICRDQKEIENHRKRIDKLIDGHALALKALQQFKVRIEKSFKQIDENYQEIRATSNKQSEDIGKAFDQINENHKLIDGHALALNELRQFREQTKKSFDQIDENYQEIRENSKKQSEDIEEALKQLNDNFNTLTHSMNAVDTEMLSLRKRVKLWALGTTIAFAISIAVATVAVVLR